MCWPVLRALCAAPLLVLATNGYAGGTTPSQNQGAVDAAVERGVGWLLSAQAMDGSWRTYAPRSRPAGATALAVYTLLKCGLSPEHPAVRKGMAFVLGREGLRTYSAGVTLMALEAIGEQDRPPDVARVLTRSLIDSQRHQGWGYPSNSKGEDPAYSDTSNTQYALLGLNAAVAMGERVDPKVWIAAAEALLGRQDRDGGWSYQRQGNPTAAMTGASVAGVYLCLNHMGAKGKARQLRPELEQSMREGLDWLAEHWSVKRNSALPRPDGDTQRWHYYWLYALERVGSFLDEEVIAGQRWFEEGAQVLLQAQESGGDWKSGYQRELDTCFALLFLRQGSRKAAAATPRSRAPRAADDAPLVVLSTEDNPRRLWVQLAREALTDHLAADGIVECVEWRVEGKTVARVEPEGDPARHPFPIEYTFTRNGPHRVQATMKLLDTHRRPAGELTSGEIMLVVDDVFTPADQEALEDLGRSVLPLDQVTVSASSTSQWTRTDGAADGLYACQWRAEADDESPWVRLDFERPVRASRLKLGAAWQAGKAEDYLARPKEVELSLGKGRMVRVTLDDRGRAKHEIPFKKTSIKSLELRILSRWPGSGSQAVGLAEIELFP